MLEKLLIEILNIYELIILYIGNCLMNDDNVLLSNIFL